MMQRITNDDVGQKKIVKPEKNKGFELIELVMILMILGIVAVVCVPLYVNLKSNAQLNGLNAALASIRSAIAFQHSQSLLSGNDEYPSNITGDIFGEKGVPTDPIHHTNAVVTTNATPLTGIVTGTTGGWLYNPTTGEVVVNHKDYDGL